MILVDSSVLLDIVSGDPVWSKWSARQVATRVRVDAIFVNAIIFAELSPRYPSHAEVDEFLKAAGIGFMHLPREAAFAAGKAHVHYRRQGGTRTGVLPDFFIGAHAAVLGATILTRDTRRYTTYFPMVRLIAP
jgi:predicted nucleic acid-binding protein